jgi:hypothetical protein
MKILLDECVTKHLMPYLPEHNVSTVSKQGWSGVKNGQLMTLAVDSGFDLLLTIDKNFQHQQNIGRYNLVVVVLDSPSSKLETLVQFLPAFELRLSSFGKGNAYTLNL